MKTRILQLFFAALILFILVSCAEKLYTPKFQSSAIHRIHYDPSTCRQLRNGRITCYTEFDVSAIDVRKK